MVFRRKQESHPEAREEVGGYLYGRMARMGLLTYMQAYDSKRPSIDPKKKKVRYTVVDV